VRQLDADEVGAVGPVDPALVQNRVDLAQRERREGAGKACRRARRGGEAGDIVEPFAGAAVVPENG
jgi:hypothetical protein